MARIGLRDLYSNAPTGEAPDPWNQSIEPPDPWGDGDLPGLPKLDFDLPRLPEIPGAKKKRKNGRRPRPYSTQADLAQSASGLAESGLSTLAAAGNIIDLTASTSRDLLWNVGQLVKPTDMRKPFAEMVNPFDQWLPWNWTSHEHRKEHRDTFRHFGLASEEDTWRNFGADFALDIVTDPLTYATMGVSVTPKIAGQIAKKAGVLGKIGNKVTAKLPKGVKAGKRVAMRQGRLKDVYAPRMADEPFDLVKSRKISDKIQAKKDYLADEFGEGTDEYVEGLDSFRMELDAEERMFSERAEELIDAANIEDAAGFGARRKELIEKYGIESNEYKNALADFQKDLLKRMDEGDLSGSLGGMFGMVNPLTGRGVSIDDYIRGSDWIAKKGDDFGAFINNSLPVRFLKQHVHAPAMGLLKKGSQALAERVYPAKRTAEAQARFLATSGAKSPANLLTKAASITEDILGEKLANATDAKGAKMLEVGPNQKAAQKQYFEATKKAGIEDEHSHANWTLLRARNLQMADELRVPVEDVWSDTEFRFSTSAPSPNAPPKIGQKVQWVSGGQNMFPEPVAIRDIQGDYVFVEPYKMPDGTVVSGDTGIHISEVQTTDELFQVFEGKALLSMDKMAPDRSLDEYAGRVDEYVSKALGDNDSIDWKGWKKRMGKLGASNLELADAGIDEEWFKLSGGKVTKQQLSNKIQEESPDIFFEDAGKAFEQYVPSTEYGGGGMKWTYDDFTNNSYEAIVAQYLDKESVSRFLAAENEAKYLDTGDLDAEMFATEHFSGAPLFHLRRNSFKTEAGERGSALLEGQSDLFQGIAKAESAAKKLKNDFIPELIKVPSGSLSHNGRMIADALEASRDLYQVDGQRALATTISELELLDSALGKLQNIGYWETYLSLHDSHYLNHISDPANSRSPVSNMASFMYNNYVKRLNDYHDDFVPLGIGKQRLPEKWRVSDDSRLKAFSVKASTDLQDNVKDLEGLLKAEVDRLKGSLRRWVDDPAGFYQDGIEVSPWTKPEGEKYLVPKLKDSFAGNHVALSRTPYSGSWEKMVINEHIRRSINEGADFIALPDPADIARGVVLDSDSPKEIAGIKFFYGNKMWNLWQKRMKQLDPSFKAPKWLGETLIEDTVHGDSLKYTRLDITPEMKKRFQSESIPLYMRDKGKTLGSFSVEDGKKIVTLFEGANFNTLVHETGHYFRRTLADTNKELLSRTEKLYGVKDGQWTRKQEESFAKDFQAYVKEGKFANREVRSVFRKFKDWLVNVYSGLVGGPGGRRIGNEIKEVFDEMISDGAGGISKVNDLKDSASVTGQILHHVRERLDKVGLHKAFDEATLRLLPDNVTAAEKARLYKELGPIVEELSGQMKEANELQINGMHTKGIPLGHIDNSKTAHAERMGALKEGADDAVDRGRVAPISGVATATRNDETAHIPELIITQMLLDPEIIKNKNNISNLTEIIKDEYTEWLDETYQQGTKKERADRFGKWVKRNYGKRWFSDQIYKWRSLLDENGQKAIDELQDFIKVNKESSNLPDSLLEKLEGLIPLQRMDNHATNLAKWLNLHAGKRVHGYDRLSNFIRYQTSATRLNLIGEALHRHALENMVPASEGHGSVMSVSDAYKRAGLNEEQAIKYLSEISNLDAEDLAKNYVVPEEIATSMSDVIKAHRPGEWQNIIIDTMDRINSYFKASVTVLAPKGVPLFPAFFERNNLSGMFVNLTSGHVSPAQVLDYAQATRKAWAVQDQLDSDYITEALAWGIIGHGKGFEGAQMLKGSVPPKLTEYMKSMIPGVGKQERKELLERVNQLADAINEDPSILAKALIEPKRGSKELLGRTEKYVGPALEKSGSLTSKVASKIRDEFAEATAWGGLLNSIVEYNNRMPMFIYLRDQGWSAKAAAEEVMRLHFDYSDLAPTERHIFKKVFPFYTFSRKAAELFANTLMTRPGGGLAKSIKLAGRVSESDAFTPHYVSKQTHVPITGIPGAAPEGSRAYITGFGLPYEDTLRMLPLTSVREAGGDILSRISPPAAGLLEIATGRSFFRNQPLPEAHRKVSQIGSNIAQGINAIAGEGTVPVPSNRSLHYLPEHIIAKSPFARVLSTANTLTDPRKTVLNKVSGFITPFKITTVSPEAQRRAVKERGAERLDALGVSRETSYTPSYALEALGPVQREEALRINALMRATRNQRFGPSN